MKRSALLFDLDGTLVDSLPDLHAALNEMLGGLARSPLTVAQVRGMIGDGTCALVERALTTASPAKDTFGQSEFEAAHRNFLRIYEAAAANLSRLYPDVKQTLDTLKSLGARLAICTNKPQKATLRVLEGFGIRQHFDVVLGGDAVSFRKPDPRHLFTAIERLGARSDRALMVGDNENDYAAARGAGIPVILMRYGYLRVPPESLSPDAWLDKFAELARTVEQL